jgi:hypothetical protein
VWRWESAAGAVRRVQDWVAVDVKQ